MRARVRWPTRFLPLRVFHSTAVEDGEPMRVVRIFFPIFLLLLLRLRLAPRTRPVGNSIKKGEGGRGGETRAQIDGGRSTIAAAAAPSPAGGLGPHRAWPSGIARTKQQRRSRRFGRNDAV